MDLIKINENKLKIMLTPLDMQSYDISAEELDSESIETRAAFRTIMDEARNRTGFDTGGNRIYVQLYPSKSGGCELFVTKLGLSGQRIKKERLALHCPKAPPKPHIFVFTFEKLEHLLRICRRLQSDSNDFCSSVRRDDFGWYYLLLQENKHEERAAFIDPMTLAYIYEYAIPNDPDSTLLYIKEHSTSICENNAIVRLSKL